MIDSNLLPTVIVDHTWSILALNSAARQRAILQEKELPGTLIWHAFPALATTGIKERIVESRNQLRAMRAEEIAPDAEPSITIRLSRVKGGYAVSFRESSEEITNGLLLSGEPRFQETFKQAEVGLAHVGLDGRWLQVNDRLCAIVGYSREELLGMSFQKLTHPNDLKHAVQLAEQLASGAISTYTMEKRYIRRDGSTVWINITRSIERDAGGAPRHFIAIIQDVDVRKRAELSLAESQLQLQEALDVAQKSNVRFRRLIDANIFGVFTWTMDGRITDGNDAFLALIGYDRSETIHPGMRWIEVSSDSWHDADERALMELRATGICATYEKEFVHKSGRRVPVLVAAALFPDSDVEGIAYAIDLTDRKAQERFEQEFLAGIAHDLKNPLAAMKAQAQLMRRRLHSGRLSEQVADEGLRSVDRNVTRVVRRIEELMDIALVRAGRSIELDFTPVDLVEMTRQRAELFQQATDRHTIRVTPTVDRLTGFWDANRIERVIDNLLSNAVKFSPDGGAITILLDREETPEGSWARVSITDRGVGVLPEDLPVVFEFTHRGSNGEGRLEGVGIGLAAAKLLVEQHHGTITAESQPGQGSTFTLRLPLILLEN